MEQSSSKEYALKRPYVILCEVLSQLRAFTSAKFPYGGFVLGLSQFSLPPQLPHKMTLNLKVKNTYGEEDLAFYFLSHCKAYESKIIVIF